MKKILKLTVIALAAVLSFTHCCKNKLTDDTYFYMNASTDESPLKLYVDGEYKGELPFINTGGSNYGYYDTIIHEGLHLTTKTSTFKIETRNAQGKIITSAVIKRNPRSAGIVSCSGPMELTQTPDFILIALQSDPGANSQDGSTCPVIALQK